MPLAVPLHQLLCEGHLPGTAPGMSCNKTDIYLYTHRQTDRWVAIPGRLLRMSLKQKNPSAMHALRALTSDELRASANRTAPKPQSSPGWDIWDQDQRPCSFFSLPPSPAKNDLPFTPMALHMPLPLPCASRPKVTKQLATVGFRPGSHRDSSVAMLLAESLGGTAE